ncbi:MAG: hypothetical protein HC771_22825 [Synechococcales cyanobacterium CRU_2_2]|nr:hypothetical protein [Synechococcales cyanobacterium CRU_2_2]
MVFYWYEFYLPCVLHNYNGYERVEWIRCKSDRLRDWIAAAKVQFPGWGFEEVLSWDAELT